MIIVMKKGCTTEDVGVVEDKVRELGYEPHTIRGEVLTVDPPRLLEFRWGSSHFRCEVRAEGEGSRLLFAETLDDPSWGALPHPLPPGPTRDG